MSFIFKLYINYNELIVFSIPAFAPKIQSSRSRAAFFVPISVQIRPYQTVI